MNFRPFGTELDATEPRRGKKTCPWVYEEQLEPANAEKRR